MLGSESDVSGDIEIIRETLFSLLFSPETETISTYPVS